MSQFCAFWCHFLAYFVTLCNFLALFALFGSLGPFMLFCCNFALFRVKYFWLKPCLCRKYCLFHVCQLPTYIILTFFHITVIPPYWWRVCYQRGLPRLVVYNALREYLQNDSVSLILNCIVLI